MNIGLEELEKHFDALCNALSKKELLTNPWLEKRIAEIRELFARIDEI